MLLCYNKALVNRLTLLSIKRHTLLAIRLTKFLVLALFFSPCFLLIHLDFIAGNLPFLISRASLRCMKSNVNCEYLNMGIKVEGKFHHIPLTESDPHVYLPFRIKGRKKSQATSYHTVNPSSNCYRIDSNVNISR